MFEEKYGVAPHKIIRWLSLYLVVGIPAYTILYKVNSFYFIAIMICENLIEYYLIQDSFLQEMVDDLNQRDIAIFFLSIFIAFISMVALVVVRPTLFLIIILAEMIAWGIKKLIIISNRE